MKFSVTITDATAEELQRVFNSLSGSTATSVLPGATVAPVPTTAIPVTAMPAPAPAPVAEDDTPNDAPPLVDNSGLPWDERIHSATKGINADGSWRKKRGVQDTLVAQVEAELRGHTVSQPTPDNVVTQAQPVAQVPGGPALPEPPGAVVQPEPIAPVTTAPAAQPQPDIMATPQPAPAAAPVEQMDYPSFMQRVMAGIQSGALDNAYIGNVLQRIGAPSITALAPDAAKLAQAIQIMQAEGKL